MQFRKATYGQLRHKNRQLLLRAIYTGLASSRAELAQETGLAKPTVGDVIGALIAEGFLIEKGLGQSTDEGGKRPRLLEFVPDARHVIGVSLTAERILGVLANLDGQVLVEHYKNLSGARGQAVLDSLFEVINGLQAQLIAPLLCLGIGVPGSVDTAAGIVRYAAHLGLHDVPLAEILRSQYRVPVYVANSTELAALAQFAFGEARGVSSLATVLVNDSVGVGLVLDGAIYHTGGEIGPLRVVRLDGNAARTEPDSLESMLGWQSVSQRAAPLEGIYANRFLLGNELTYLHIQQAVQDQQPLAVALQDELADYLAQIFAWIIALVRPDHISLAGTIADMGASLLDCAVDKTRALIAPDLMQPVTFSQDNSANLVALGAVAKTLQQELGLI